MAIRLQDIAQHLGLSVSTVSLALRDAPQISEETRLRVRDAAVQLGYVHRPRQAPRTEVKQIAFITNVVSTNEFYSAVLSGAERECREHGITLQYALLQELTPRRLTQYADADGLLVVGSIDEATVLRLQSVSRPLVLIDNNLPHLGIDRVVIENMGSVYRTVAWLVERGHRRIGFLCGPGGHPSFEERLHGYRLGMAAWGLDGYEIANLSMQEQSIKQTVIDQIQPGGALPFTALIAYHDRAAVFALHALQDNGVRVPDDVSLVGFDDIDMVRLVRPTLATCHVYRDALGVLGVRRLIERSQLPDQPALALTLDTMLVEGGSVRSLTDEA